MDLAVRATPARWWYAHKENIASWDNIKRLMAIRFSDDRRYAQCKYTGETDPRVHIKSVNRTGRIFQRMNGFTDSFTHWTQLQGIGI